MWLLLIGQIDPADKWQSGRKCPKWTETTICHYHKNICVNKNIHGWWKTMQHLYGGKNFQVNCYNCYLGGNRPQSQSFIHLLHSMWCGKKKEILSRFNLNVTKKYMLSSACEIFSMNFSHSLRSERNSTLGQNQSWGKCICGVINVFGAARKEWLRRTGVQPR